MDKDNFIKQINQLIGYAEEDLKKSKRSGYIQKKFYSLGYRAALRNVLYLLELGDKESV